jgi:hypothetical protein
MSPALDTRRLHRSLAAVESRYVRDLGRRVRGGSPAARAATRPSAGARRDAPEPHESGRPSVAERLPADQVHVNSRALRHSADAETQPTTSR